MMGWRWLGLGETGDSRDDYGRRATEQPRVDGFQDTLTPRAGAVCSWITIACELSVVLLLVPSCP